MEKIILQGAEAQIILDNNIIKKRRTKKSYRFPALDEKIRKQRTKKEAKLLEKSSKLIPIPKILKIDEKTKEIDIEYIQGRKLSEHLESLPYKETGLQIGKQIAKLHDNSIIHGDLTTSNMILSHNNKLYFIDFGLGFISSKIEDKAVDLHLIKEALEAKHFEIAEKCFKAILKGYSSSPNYSQVLARLKKVEQRGRYKAQY